MTDVLDVLIAGAGTAGILTAARLIHDEPELKVALVEKEKIPGGRIRSVSEECNLWGYGLSHISKSLLQYWDQTLKLDPECIDISEANASPLNRIGVLAAAKISELPVAEWFSKKGARAIGGGAAARDWKSIDTLSEAFAAGKKKEQSFQGAWNGTRKSPAGIVIEHMAASFGIPDVWSSSTMALLHRAQQFSSDLMVGDWNVPLETLITRIENHENASYHSDCTIIGASYQQEEKHWVVSTRGGIFLTKTLIVAQSPWDALKWLPKSYWPTDLLQLAIKTKPTSIVVLSELLEPESKEQIDLPQITLIPAEGVQIYLLPSGELCYQATIDFETSLQAPDVGKAVRRLKRARKKLKSAVPNLESSGEHIALLSVGWAQPTGFSDQRMRPKMDPTNLNTNTLMFCGDAYGSSLDGDQNIIESSLNIANTLANAPTTEPAVLNIDEQEAGEDER